MSDALGLNLWAVVSHPTWVVGSRLVLAIEHVVFLITETPCQPSNIAQQSRATQVISDNLSCGVSPESCLLAWVGNGMREGEWTKAL